MADVPDSILTAYTVKRQQLISVGAASMIRRCGVVAAALVCALGFSACMPAFIPPAATPAPTLAPTNTSRFNTVSAPVVRATLPPTWTPTPLRTDLPAPTRLHSQPTSTPLPPPTLDDVCLNLLASPGFVEGEVFTREDTIPLSYGTAYRSVLNPRTNEVETFYVQVAFRHKASDDELVFTAPPGDLYGVLVDGTELGFAGVYEWTVSIIGSPLGEQCIKSGTFVLEDPPPTPNV